MRLLVSSAPTILPSLLPEFAPWLGTLVTPSNGALPQAMRMLEAHGLPWAADNEAFSGFDPDAFLAMLERLRGLPGCLWVAAPDIVGDAARTLDAYGSWEPAVRQRCGQPVALVAQDGLERLPVPWGRVDALFIGGSTAWKLSRHAAGLMAEARSRGKLVHVGRCNSLRRYRIAHERGADTVDGTNVCMFPSRWLPVMARALRGLDAQRTIFAEGP